MQSKKAVQAPEEKNRAFTDMEEVFAATGED